MLAPLLGLLLDRFVFRRLSRASDGSKIMATVGVLVAVPALAELIVSLLAIRDGVVPFVGIRRGPRGLEPAVDAIDKTMS